MEDPIGRPLLTPAFLSSKNLIRLAADLVWLSQKTNSALSDMRTVIEWGGGYGCMAKIARRMSPGRLTYIIIDVPLISSLQWLYLSTIFGESAVNLFHDGTESIQEGKFNLIPVCFVEKYSLKADLFISTFALSESSAYAHDFVDKMNFFGAKHIWLEYHGMVSVFRERYPIIESMALKHGLKIESPRRFQFYAYR